MIMSLPRAVVVVVHVQFDPVREKKASWVSASLIFLFHTLLFPLLSLKLANISFSYWGPSWWTKAGIPGMLRRFSRVVREEWQECIDCVFTIYLKVTSHSSRGCSRSHTNENEFGFGHGREQKTKMLFFVRREEVFFCVMCKLFPLFDSDNSKLRSYLQAYRMQKIRFVSLKTVLHKPKQPFYVTWHHTLHLWKV